MDNSQGPIRIPFRMWLLFEWALRGPFRRYPLTHFERMGPIHSLVVHIGQSNQPWSHGEYRFEKMILTRVWITFGSVLSSQFPNPWEPLNQPQLVHQESSFLGLASQIGQNLALPLLKKNPPWTGCHNHRVFGPTSNDKYCNGIFDLQNHVMSRICVFWRMEKS